MLWSKRLRSEQLASYEGIDLSHVRAGRPNAPLRTFNINPANVTFIPIRGYNPRT